VGDFQPISISDLRLMLSLWACGQRACVVHHVHGKGARWRCGFWTARYGFFKSTINLMHKVS
jgi:hypothetical protein